MSQVEFALGTGYLAALIVVAKDCELSRLSTYLYCSMTTTFLACTLPRLLRQDVQKTQRSKRESTLIPR